MVTFSGVGQFLSRTRIDNPSKRNIRVVFRQLRKGELYIPGRSKESVIDLFRSEECRLWMAFLARVTITEKPLSVTQFVEFSGDGLGLGPLYVFLKEFLKSEDELLPDDEEFIEEIEPGTVVTGAFLICNDHEGIMPMVLLSPNVTPKAGMYILHEALHQRLLGEKKV